MPPAAARRTLAPKSWSTTPGARCDGGPSGARRPFVQSDRSRETTRARHAAFAAAASRARHVGRGDGEARADPRIPWAPAGAVAERLGRGLQSLVQRFESARRLCCRPREQTGGSCWTPAFPSRSTVGPLSRAAACGSPTWTRTGGFGSTRSRASSRTSRSTTSARRAGASRSTSGSCAGIRIDVLRPFLDDGEVELTTWCSGVAAIAAGRRWSVTGDAGGSIEVDSVWIHLDAQASPARIEDFGVYAEAARRTPRLDEARAAGPARRRRTQALVAPGDGRRPARPRQQRRLLAGGRGAAPESRRRLARPAAGGARLPRADRPRRGGRPPRGRGRRRRVRGGRSRQGRRPRRRGRQAVAGRAERARSSSSTLTTATQAGKTKTNPRKYETLKSRTSAIA